MASLSYHVGRVRDALGTMRVVPPTPRHRVPIVRTMEAQPRPPRRDDSSSWTAYIRYVDANGDESERRFTCHRIEGVGSASHVFGHCHERDAVRLLKIERIVELIDAETGEDLDPVAHFELLREAGALKVKDKVLTELVRMLVFLARCDGHYHPLEREALESHIDRYCLRFNGTERLATDTMSECRRLAPDAKDMVTAIKRLAKAPDGPRVCKFVLDCGADIIGADGRHMPEEIEWAVEISAALKAIADRR